MSQPSKQQILEKYRNVIDTEDFELLVENGIPMPEEARLERSEYEYFGTLNGWYVWAKRKFGKLAAIIMYFGGFMQGFEYIDKYARFTYDQVESIHQAAESHPDQPAKIYAIVEPRQSSVSSSDRTPFCDLINAPSNSVPPVGDQTQIEFPIGTGMVPYSGNWT